MQAWSKVSRMTAPNIKKMQDELLARMLKEFSEKHPYYRSLFSSKNIDPGLIKGTDDLKKLPFTNKQDMVPSDADPLKPKQFVLEQSPEDNKTQKKRGFGLFAKKESKPSPGEYKLIQLYYTAGRTEEPVPLVFTRYDLDNLKEVAVRAFDILELERDHTVLNALSFAPNVSFWQMFYSTINVGSTALHSGGGRVLGMEKIILALNNMKAPVLVAYPGYALAILQACKHFGQDLPALERILIGMDYAPMIYVERIQKLMQQVNAAGNRVQRLYFVSEAKSGWAECEPGFGYHTNPDHVFIEIVDPKTGVPLGEGEPGEVVVTNLDSRGTALLRFRTGDITTEGLTTEPCPNCRRTVPRILGNIERKDLYLELRDKEALVELNGNVLRQYLVSREDILTCYSEIICSEGCDLLKVVVKGSSGVNEESLKNDLELDLKNTFKVPVEVDTCSFEAAAKKTGLENRISAQQIFDLRD